MTERYEKSPVKYVIVRSHILRVIMSGMMRHPVD